MTLGDLFYSTTINRTLGWVTFKTDWESDTGGNAVRYTRDGTNNQLSGSLVYRGPSVEDQPRNYGTVLNFAPFATFASPLGNVSYDFAIIGSGLSARWILATNGTLILYRPRSTPWALAQNEVFPISLQWLAPPGDPFYGLGPSSPR